MTVEVIDNVMSDQNHAKENNPAPPLSSRHPVKRSLFGAVNHEECLNFFKKEMESMTKEASQRWNFDFATNRPLAPSNGSYEWIPIQPAGVIPHVYTANRLDGFFDNVENVESDQPNSVPEIRVTESPRPQYKQKTINDYYTSCKRASDSRSQSHHAKLSERSSPPNKRPRQNECV